MHVVSSGSLSAFSLSRTSALLAARSALTPWKTCFFRPTVFLFLAHSTLHSSFIFSKQSSNHQISLRREASSGWLSSWLHGVLILVPLQVWLWWLLGNYIAWLRTFSRIAWGHCLGKILLCLQALWSAISFSWFSAFRLYIGIWGLFLLHFLLRIFSVWNASITLLIKRVFVARGLWRRVLAAFSELIGTKTSFYDVRTTKFLQWKIQVWKISPWYSLLSIWRSLHRLHPGKIK